MSTLDVLVVGSCVQDLVSYAERLPRAGESVRGDRFAVGFGGKGANQAVAAAKLGATVAMVAKVGNDMFGPSTVQNFRDNGVDATHVKVVDGASTGTASINVSRGDGQNCIVLVEAANQLLQPQDVDEAAELIASAKLLLCQLEVPPVTSLHAMKVAHHHGVTTMLNPAPGLPELDDELLKHCDILCPNENEAEFLLGLSEPLDSIELAKEAAKAIGAMMGSFPTGEFCVIVTLGDRGCVLFAPAAGVTEPIHLQCEKGAGDSFIGSLAYFLSRPAMGAKPHTKPELMACVVRACSVASISVTKPGTQSSYPTMDQLPVELFE